MGLGIFTNLQITQGLIKGLGLPVCPIAVRLFNPLITLADNSATILIGTLFVERDFRLELVFQHFAISRHKLTARCLRVQN